MKFHVPFFYRYVDDIITCVPSGSVNRVLEIFKKYHPRIDSTVEKESERRDISFLDVKLQVDEQGKIPINWYQKETWSGRFLNFRSHHPLSQKVAVVFNLVDKIKNLGDVEFFEEKHSLKHPPKPKQNATLATEERPLVVVVPYVQQIAHKIQKTLKQYKIKTAFCNKKKNCNNFVKLKDRDQLELKSYVVYEIPCSDCDKVYVGESNAAIFKKKIISA